jgi:hypothetical protein
LMTVLLIGISIEIAFVLYTFINWGINKLRGSG